MSSFSGKIMKHKPVGTNWRPERTFGIKLVEKRRGGGGETIRKVTFLL